MSSNAPLRCTLPSDVGRWVRREARRGGWRTPGAYVTYLVRGARDEYTTEEIEEKLIEALDAGPGRKMGPDDWQALWEKSLAKAAKLKAARATRNITRKNGRRAAA